MAGLNRRSLNSPGLRLFAAVFLFAGVVSVLAARALRLLNLSTDPGNHEHWVFVDFRDQIYFPTLAFSRGENPYDGLLLAQRYPIATHLVPYSPLTLLVNLPLSWLSFHAAELVYFTAIIGLTLILVFSALKAAKVRPSWAWVLSGAACVLASRPGHSNLLNGQSAAQLALAVCIALVFAERRPWLAGAALAFATIKPTYAIPLALLLLARGAFPAVLRAVAIATPLTLLGLGILVRNAGGLAPFVASIQSSLGAWSHNPINDPLRSETRVDISTIAARYFHVSPELPGQLFLSGLVLGLAAYFVWRLAREPKEASAPLSQAIASLALLISCYHQNYDLLVLVLPATTLLARRLRAPGREQTWQEAGLLCLFTLLAANYFASVSLNARLATSPALKQMLITVNPTALLLAFGLLISLAREALVASQPSQAETAAVSI